MNKDLPKLLRAIAGGTQAKENRHDIIFNAAADELEHRDKALDLAVCLLGKYEPPDSRAVSDVFVALAAVSCGNDNQECWDIIDKALEMERQQ